MDTLEDLDVISVQEIELSCVIGVLPHERIDPQPMVVEVSLYLDTREGGDKESLGACVDYVVLTEIVHFMLEQGRFGLLETAAQGLAKALLLSPLPGSEVPRPELLRLGLRKPQALGRRGIPSLLVTREATEVQVERQPYDWGFSETIQETERARFRRLILAPGRTLELGGLTHQSISTLSLTRGLLSDGAPVETGARLERAEGQKMRWANSGSRWAALLLVEDPRERPLLHGPLPL